MCLKLSVLCCYSMQSRNNKQEKHLSAHLSVSSSSSWSLSSVAEAVTVAQQLSPLESRSDSAGYKRSGCDLRARFDSSSIVGASPAEIRNKLAISAAKPGLVFCLRDRLLLLAKAGESPAIGGGGGGGMGRTTLLTTGGGLVQLPVAGAGAGVATG